MKRQDEADFLKKLEIYFIEKQVNRINICLYTSYKFHFQATKQNKSNK